MRNQKIRSRKLFLSIRYLLHSSLILIWLILLQAVCLGAPYTLSITANNGSVRVNPDKVSYDEGEKVELIPKPDTGYCFKEWQGDAQSKRLVLNLTMDSDKTIIANFETWKPPIGIPMPEFGIFETYRMYDVPANRNPALTYTQNAEGGYYTHYIDNTHLNATDTSNPYGTASKPRKTIPNNLPEGSVVELHGTYDYAEVAGYSIIEGAGTALKPIFIRGLNQQERVIIPTRFIPEASYMIFENIDFNGGRFGFSESRLAHHISLRNCEFRNRTTTSIFVMGPAEGQHNLVFYNNEVHNSDVGWDTPGADVDAGGVGINRFAHHVWVVDNHLYHNAGGAINAGQYGYGMMDVHHLYYGRNYAHHNRQSSLAFKVVSHIIVSENIVHSHITSQLQSGNIGAGICYQYNPDNSWILYNEIYDSECGIKISDGGTNAYHIGNLIYNISSNVIAFEAGAAISIRGAEYPRNINNIIYNTDAGIKSAYGNPVDITNNIISNMREGQHVFVEQGRANLTLRNNLFYQAGQPVTIRWGGSHGDVAGFEAAHPANAQDNIEADPLFVDAANSDFHLQSTSPAIDAGVLSDVYQTFYDLYGIDIRKDIEGRTRPQGSTWDIGTYEYGASSPPNKPPIANAGPNQTVTDKDKDGSEQVTLDGSASSDPDGTIVSFLWTEDDRQIATVVKPTVTLSAGTHTITLTVTDNGGLIDTDTVTIKVLKESEEFGELPMGCYNNVINPASGEKAIIVVEIEQQGGVKIDLYDTQGRRIRQLANEEKETGRHKYYWDGKDDSGNVVGSGLYFVHIQVGDYKKTKKIVVVK